MAGIAARPREFRCPKQVDGYPVNGHVGSQGPGRGGEVCSAMNLLSLLRDWGHHFRCFEGLLEVQKDIVGGRVTSIPIRCRLLLLKAKTMTSDQSSLYVATAANGAFQQYRRKAATTSLQPEAFVAEFRDCPCAIGMRYRRAKG